MPILIALLAFTAHAWGTQGQPVIANLAQAQLTARAKAEIDKLLALEPGETLATISTWADEHRNPTTAAWHYVNFPKNTCTYDTAPDCTDEDLPTVGTDATPANDESKQPQAPTSSVRTLAPTISGPQQARLQRLVIETGTDLQRLLANFSIGNLAELPAAEFVRVTRTLENRRAA